MPDGYGSGRMPSASNLRRASSSAHVWILKLRVGSVESRRRYWGRRIIKVEGELMKGNEERGEGP